MPTMTMMDVKLFTIEEANALIPRLTPMIPRLRVYRDRITQSEMEVDLRHIMLETQSTAERVGQDPAIRKMMKARKHLIREFRALIRDIQGMGAELKHIDPGLVDFYAERQGELVFLCWREGEDQIRAWHTLDGGFAGRRPLEGF